MLQKNKKNKIKAIIGKKKLIFGFLVFCLSFGFFGIKSNTVKANILTRDEQAIIELQKSQAQEEGLDLKNIAKEKAGSVALRKAIYNALQTLAYDTATWIGSGGKGQKPLFIREGWGEYLTNIADNAAGEFIEAINNKWGVDMCEPSLGVKFKIGLGLVQFARPEKPDCTFTEMKQNWENELQRPDFLSRFQNSFEPTSSDLGIALSLHTRLTEESNYDVVSETQGRIENEGWLDVKDIGGRRDSPPKYAEKQLGITMEGQLEPLAAFTGDALVDATNVFLNQLAITLFNNLMSSIGKGGDTYTSSYGGDYGLGDYEAGPTSGGIAGAKNRLRRLIEPNFTVRGDYDILAELTQCPNPTKAGPTNCVITENSRQAIIDKMTVGEALEQGYLNPNGVFGFTADGLEPSYNEGYPYRSMIILRKFRIIPVGWEVAAQYIKESSGAINGTKNLNDLVSCFDQNDEYTGYYASWCSGLVDPSWVLKAPLNYCKREGSGPEIINEQIVGQGDSSRLAISRNSSYCADEQSCIKEYKDGSCQFYGYCTEERRKWNFDGEACEPKYNTCQIFRSDGGKTMSYLENTLDYGNCSFDNAGCKWYCEDYYSMDPGDPYPVAYWDFDGDLKDGSGNDNNGADMGNISFVPGIKKQGAEFDGSADYVEVADDPSLNIAGPMTISAWFRADSIGGYDSIISKTSDGNWLDGYGMYFEGAPAPETINFYVGQWNQNRASASFDFSQAVTTGALYNVVGTYDGTTVSIYVNGVKGNDGSIVTPIAFSGQPLRIGVGDDNAASGTGLSYLFDGLIDEVSIYNVALTQEQVRDYYLNFAPHVRGDWNCTGVSGNKIYLDNSAEECGAEDEGCHEFIRTKPGLGTNLVWNSSFEIKKDTNDLPVSWYFDADFNSGIVDEGLFGVRALNVIRDDPATDSSFNSGAIMKNWLFKKDEVLVASVWFKTDPGKYGSMFFGDANGPHPNDNTESVNCVEGTGDWQRISVAHTMSHDDVMSVYLYSGGPGCGVNGDSVLFDGVQVERIKYETDEPSQYKDYRAINIVYEKLAPDYLNCDGVSDFSKCNQFATQCERDDVGCELYTSSSNGMSIPAKVTAEDYCSSECSGYDIYIQKDAIFDSTRDEYFVPSLAKSCSAEVVGCDEFTNLDAVADGGEGIEYYYSLRQCVLEDNPNCRGFYTWEGSSETGYQLKVYQYVEDFDGDDVAAAFDCDGDGFVTATDCVYANDPAITQDDSAECNKIIYNLPSSDPAYNADCIEYYNDAGDISYHLKSRTITCSDDCHPFRRTENNIDLSILTQAACGDGDNCTLPAADGDAACWDTAKNVCYSCVNGGYWDIDHSACVYDAIPGQGKICSSDAAGCREYTGNSGNNMKTILSSDFEGNTQNWTGIQGSTAVLSSESLTVGGESLFIDSVGATLASTTVGQLVTENKSYVISFIAKSDVPVNDINFYLTNGVNISPFSSVASLSDTEWRIFELNLPQLNHAISDSESLVVNGSAGGFYIDNIKLVEIVDRYYLTKGSLSVPTACYTDIYGDPVGALYNLGCDGYSDRDGSTHYLRQFSQLCSESVVGCELMIDTHNYSDYNGKTFHAGDLSEVVIEPDSFDYVVFDRNKQCGNDNKGCQFLGEYYKYKEDFLFNDSYLKNNPDKYESIMCYADEDGCEKWTTEEGNSYFKDPGDQVCEWRQESGKTSGSWGWYKKKIKRCDINGDGAGDGEVCLTDGDCKYSISCQLESADNSCPVDYYKAFGINGSSVTQPKEDLDGNIWAGLCPAEESGCTEYIDPISKFSENIIFNGDFSQDVDKDLLADGWSQPIDGTQTITLETETLYVLSVDDDNTAEVTMSDPNYSFELDFENNLIASSSIVVTSASGERKSRVFFVATNINSVDQATIKVGYASTSNGSKIELKKAVVDYQLKQNVDKQSCNGIVNFEDGCVLFNERGQDGQGLATSIYDADLTKDDGSGVSPQGNSIGEENNSNVLIKANPDRVCNEWLACRSIVSVKEENGEKRNVCFDIGLCNSIDENGNCDNFVLENKKEQNIFIPGDFSQYANAVGYTKVGYSGVSDYGMKGDYQLGTMNQVGELVSIPNGDFEIVSASGNPNGWVPEGKFWNKNMFSIIDDPVEAQNEGVDYPVSGNNFLKLGVAASSTSELISVLDNTDYVLTASVNTVNLSNGQAKIKVEEYSLGGVKIKGVDMITYDSGRDWSYQLGKFTTDGNTSTIKLVLYTDGNVGNYYFDDIKIRPSLESRKDWYTSQTCRLYPEDSSLSCDYYGDSGMRMRGWWGNCLEYDRYPGSSDACLLWWPVDKVKSDGIEEGAGYSGRQPLYYCTGVGGGLDNSSFNFISQKPCQDFQDCGAAGWSLDPIYSDGVVLLTGGNEIYIDDGSNCSNDKAIYRVEVKVDDGYPWVEVFPATDRCDTQTYIDVSAATIGANYFKSVKIYCTGDCDITNFSMLNKYEYNYCSDLVQTVTTVGQNKFWSGRMYEGSNYSFPCNPNIDLLPQTTTCNYAISYPPFGSIYPPSSSSNPEEWDGLDAPGIQPLYYKVAIYKDLVIEMGQEHDVNNVQRIFAQSYGSWKWDGGKYVATYSTWDPPSVLCNGDGSLPRPAYPNDLCSILPLIQNIKINNLTLGVQFIKNGFARLTFNTDIDDQQMPLVMYAIDWGDNEETVVTGVEMLDKPNVDLPHELYHLYNYWDLKAKSTIDQSPEENTVYCGVVGGETCNYGGINTNGSVCGTGDGYRCTGNDCCVLKPRIKVKDNWGWCNAGAETLGGAIVNPTGLDDCNQWSEFIDWVVVYEQ